MVNEQKRPESDGPWDRGQWGEDQLMDFGREAKGLAFVLKA